MEIPRDFILMLNISILVKYGTQEKVYLFRDCCCVVIKFLLYWCCENYLWTRSGHGIKFIEEGKKDENEIENKLCLIFILK